MDNLDQWEKLLLSTEFFGSFSHDECGEVLKFCEIRKYGVQEYVFEENQPGKTFFVILKGVAHIVVKDSLNVKREVGKLTAGDCFGEIAILLEGQRSASVRAGEESYILKMSSDSIEKCGKDTQIKIYRSFGVMLAKRLIIVTDG